MSMDSTSKRRRAKLTAGQKDAAQARTQAMLAEIASARKETYESILRLSEHYSRSPQWIAAQLYVKPRAKEANPGRLFNALLHDRRLQLEAQGVVFSGRDALPNLAKQIKNEDWRNIPEEEQERLLRQLDEHVEAKKKAKKVKPADIGRDVQATLDSVDSQLIALASRTGAQMFYVVMRNTVGDVFDARTFTTSRAAQAVEALYAETPNKMAMRLESYITSGVAGVIKAAGIKKSSWMKKEIRRLLNDGMRNILLENEYLEDTLPENVSYAKYEDFVCKWGVELVGWTEDSMCNPGDIKSTARLTRLWEALNEGTCHWEKLDDKTLESRRKANSYQDRTSRKKSRTRSKKARPTFKSKAIVDSEPGSDSEEDSNNEGASTKRKLDKGAGLKKAPQVFKSKAVIGSESESESGEESGHLDRRESDEGGSLSDVEPGGGTSTGRTRRGEQDSASEPELVDNRLRKRARYGSVDPSMPSYAQNPHHDVELLDPGLLAMPHGSDAMSSKGLTNFDFDFDFDFDVPLDGLMPFDFGLAAGSNESDGDVFSELMSIGSSPSCPSTPGLEGVDLSGSEFDHTDLHLANTAYYGVPEGSGFIGNQGTHTD